MAPKAVYLTRGPDPDIVSLIMRWGSMIKPADSISLI